MTSNRLRPMSRLSAALAAGVLATGLLAACGGDESDSGTTQAPTTAATTATETTTTGAQTETTATETSTQEAAADGKAVFTQNCGSCHTLAAAGTSGNVGPNLDDLKPSASKVESMVKSGGSGMPPFEGVLSAAEISAVSEYVAEVAGS